MKYFTPELYVQLQILDDEATFDAANNAWSQAVDRYDRHLDQIRGRLPSSVQGLLNSCNLHDADVLAIKQSGNTLVIVLQLDAPPNEILELAYTLDSDPIIIPVSLPAEYCSERPEWMYDEIDVELPSSPNQAPVFLHTVQLSNGYQLQIRFKALDVKRSTAVLPAPRSFCVSPAATGAASQQA